MSTKSRSLDLGALQSIAERATTNLKTATANYKRAKETFDRADAEYAVAQKALLAGVEQLKAATKVNA